MGVILDVALINNLLFHQNPIENKLYNRLWFEAYGYLNTAGKPNLGHNFWIRVSTATKKLFDTTMKHLPIPNQRGVSNKTDSNWNPQSILYFGVTMLLMICHKHTTAHPQLELLGAINSNQENPISCDEKLFLCPSIDCINTIYGKSMLHWVESPTKAFNRHQFESSNHVRSLNHHSVLKTTDCMIELLFNENFPSQRWPTP